MSRAVREEGRDHITNQSQIIIKIVTGQILFENLIVCLIIITLRNNTDLIKYKYKKFSKVSSPIEKFSRIKGDM